MHEAGLYVHIPFCRSRCGYCHFTTSVVETQEPYVEALIGEIEERGRSPEVGRMVFDSVYFGGGTPSLLRADLFALLIHRLRATFRIERGCEITIEANPDAGVAANAAFYAEQGVNRVSIGAQSAVPAELDSLDRRHSVEDVRASLPAIRRHIENVNLDFILGIPGQDQASLDASLALIDETAPSHVSFYILELSEESKPGRLAPPEDETVERLYRHACRIMRSRGYVHYEICNFGKPGRECRHNQKYWDGSDYLGLGLSACSLYAGGRIHNTTQWADYLDDPARHRRFIPTSDEALSRETIFLSLRQSKGLTVSSFQRRFGYDPYARFKSEWDELMEFGLVVRDGDRFYIPEDRMLMGNEVFVRFV
ncbi:MAG: coproporphyrinogen-III oxidase family protein [Acidobacteriota bacterium]